MNMRYKQVVTSDYIYHDLLNRIIDLEYKPGEGISENELCEKYSATRHSIRGALAVLKEKGFIEVIPQRGTYVTLIDLRMIDDILFLRSAVELEALRVIFRQEDQSGLLQQLNQCLKEQLEMTPSDSQPEEFYRLDDDFHGILLRAAGHESVRDLYEDAFLHVRRWRNMEVGEQERIANLPKEHERIIEAIEKGDQETAFQCMEYHINSVNQFGQEMKTKYPQYFI